MDNYCSCSKISTYDLCPLQRSGHKQDTGFPRSPATACLQSFHVSLSRALRLLRRHPVWHGQAQCEWRHSWACRSCSCTLCTVLDLRNPSQFQEVHRLKWLLFISHRYYLKIKFIAVFTTDFLGETFCFSLWLISSIAETNCTPYLI